MSNSNCIYLYNFFFFSDLPSGPISPDKGTQTTLIDHPSDQTMTEFKYLDRKVETNLSLPKKKIEELSAIIFREMGENKDSTDKNIESESSKMDKCEIKTNKKIEIKISRSTIEEIDNSQKTANKNDNSSYSSNISGNVVDDDSRSLNLEESENRKSDEIMKSDGNAKKDEHSAIEQSKTKKKDENLSQLDDISDESNGFNDNLEELEEKLHKAHKKLKKLESKDKKSKKESKSESKKEKSSGVSMAFSLGSFLNQGNFDVEGENSSSKDVSKTKKDKRLKENVDKSNKKSKKIKDNSEKQKVKSKSLKENKNENYRKEDDVIIATPPHQEIEVIEIPDDEDETQYSHNLDKKIIKSYSGHDSQKSRSRHNLDLKSVVKREKPDKESSRRHEGDKNHERDRSRDRKKLKKYKSRSKSRERRERHRSRSRERSRRSRSRDRYKKSRRSRSRSRDRSRRSRERGWSRERDRDRDRSKERERSRKHKRRDRSSSRERIKIKSRDRSRDSRDRDFNRWREVSPEVSLNMIRIETGRLDTGRLIDLFDDKWKKREDLKQAKKKKKDRVSPIKNVQSPIKRPLEEETDNVDMLLKKAKTPVKEKVEELIETVQPIQKIIDVFPENTKDDIDMFAEENSDMDTEIPEQVQDNVIVINTVENINKLHPQRPNLVSLPVVTDVNKISADKQALENSEDFKENEMKNTIPVINNIGDKNGDSPEYDPAFPTDDIENSPSPLLDEKSPPGTPVEYTNFNNPSHANPRIIIGEPPSSMPLTQVVDENYPGQRLSPMTQLPPQLGGKGLLGEGGPFLLQRGEAPLLQQEIPTGIRLLQGLRPGVSPQQAVLMNPLLMNRPPQFQPRFARFPPGHLPPFGLQVTTQDGVTLQGPFPPRMAHGGIPPQPGLINGNFEGIHTDTSQPPPPFQLLPGSANPRLAGDPRMQLPPHLLTQGPPPGPGVPPLQLHPGIERVSIAGPLMEGPHISLSGQPVSIGTTPRLALPNHQLSIPSSQIGIPSPEKTLGNPLTKLPTHLSLPRFQVPITNPQVSVASSELESEVQTPPTPTNDDTPFMNLAIEASQVSRSQSPKVSLNMQLSGNKPLISIAEIGTKTYSQSVLKPNKDPPTTESKSLADEYPSPDENEGDDIIKNSDSSGNLQAAEQLTQLTKLLSAQAQLAQLVTKSKQTSGKSSHNNGRSKSKVDQFKVPLPPRGKNSNGKVVKEVESIDVIDMDVASPLDESSIEIPDSPDGFDKSYFGTSGQKEKENKKRRDKHDRKEHKHKDKKVRDLTSSVKFNDAGKKPVMTVNDDNLKDVIRELELEDMPSSAVELTNKEKVIGMKSGTEFILSFYIYFFC